MTVDPLIFGMALAGLGILLLLLVRLEIRLAGLASAISQHSGDPLRRTAEQLGALHATLEGVTRQVERLVMVERSLLEVEEDVGKLVSALLGRGGGRLGERWMEAHLSWLPEGWIRERVRMGGGEVEFALVLPGGLLVPLDSKLVAPELLSAWEAADEVARREVERRLVRSVRERAQEIAQRYLLDPSCAGFGVAVVPDPVYALCRSALRDLVSDRVVLVPYTLLAPFVASLYLLGQRMGLGGLGQGERRLGAVRDAVRAAERELERMGPEVAAVSNQRVRALEHLRQASRALEPKVGGAENRMEEGEP
ncbi:MAG: DNA recombination protein RmuC [Armatimonadetes bacterium]|nr:DNA recombination protein RmuC [Armatimonadota bacterium]MDW8153389.1 DNA recombination protein RmuC [Armatimonadota bacterium]